MEDKWFNIEDAAEYLSITEDTARTWVREGRLPAYKVGKRYKLKLSEIDEWVRSGKINEGGSIDGQENQDSHNWGKSQRTDL